MNLKLCLTSSIVQEVETISKHQSVIFWIQKSSIVNNIVINDLKLTTVMINKTFDLDFQNNTFEFLLKNINHSFGNLKYAFAIHQCCLYLCCLNISKCFNDYFFCGYDDWCLLIVSTSCTIEEVRHNFRFIVIIRGYSLINNNWEILYP